MTSLRRPGRLNGVGAWLLALLAAVGLLVFGAGTASAHTQPDAGNRVRACAPETITAVGVSEHIAAGQGRGPPVLQRQIVVATGVAAESAEVFHHRTMSDEITQQIVHSGRLLGKGNRYSDDPMVRAFRGPLQEGQRGVEFTTRVPTTPGTRVGPVGHWTPDIPGVEVGPFNGVPHAGIPITILRTR